MLNLHDINAGYADSQVLFDVSLIASPGQVHCIMGRNGAGKTTLMRAIMGLVPLTSGTAELDGVRLDTLAPHEVPRHGIGYVPQGRRLFSDLSVEENLEIGLMTRKTGPEVREKVLTMFPRLRERLRQRAETLSGGEQQMLATARALCIAPSVLLLDEPTEGLQPSMIAAIREAVVSMRDEGVAVLLVEQRVEAVLGISDRVTFLENGQVAESRLSRSLAPDDAAFKKFVGV